MIRFLSRAGAAAAAALILCLSLSCRVQASSGYYPEKEHSELDFSEYDCREFDDTSLRENLAALEALISGDAAPQEGECEALFAALEDGWAQMSAWYNCLDIAAYADVYDEEAAAAAADAEEALTRMADEIARVLQLVAASPSRDALNAYFGEETAESLADYMPLEDWEIEFNRQENELVQRYYQESDADPGVEYNGETWTFERFMSDPPYAEEDYYGVYTALCKEQNARLTDILIELNRIRTDAAMRWDYDSVAEYRDELYGRDYTEEDLEGVYRSVQRYFVPLLADLDSCLQYSDDVMTLERFDAANAVQILDGIGASLSKVHPDLCESFDALRSHHLYDMKPGEKRADVGFTTDLKYYGTAFIFNTPEEDWSDYTAMIHEFGHFNAAYHDVTSIFADSVALDVAEIQSQGLELLMAHFADDFLPGAGEAYQLCVIERMVSGVVEGCFFDELQREILRHPEWTAEEINRCAYDLGTLYGFPIHGSDKKFYSWVMTSHTFDSPLYYVSYATSGLSALDIGGMAGRDWDGAVDRYMRISAEGGGSTYRGVTEACGLRDIFARDSIESIAKDIRTLTKLEDRLAETEKMLAAEDRIFIAICAVIALVLFLLIALFVFLLRRLLRRRAFRRNARGERDVLPTRQDDLPEWQNSYGVFDDDEIDPPDCE